MTLTVETGAGVAGADSFVDVSYADAYLSSMGYTIWTPLLTAEKEAALRMAARWLDAQKYSGERLGYDYLAWPRVGAMFDSAFSIPSDAIPENLKRAQCEAAIRAAQGTLTADTSGGYVTEKRLEGMTIKYSDMTESQKKRMEVVMDLLAPLMSGAGLGMRVVRG